MNTLDQIKQNLLIPEILPEVRDNQNICCPFPDHQDDKPSFRYYPESNSFYCFGCGRGGTVIDLLMHLNNWPVAEAIDFGKQKLGISDKPASPEELIRIDQEKRREEILIRVTDDCFSLLWSDTPHPLASRARSYLKKRGFSKKLLQEQRIGLIDVALLRKNGDYINEDLELAGLLNRGKSDRYYPLIKSPRIWYPVIHRQRVVYGVCGKLIEDDKEPDKKYKNLFAGPLNIGSKRYLYNHDASYRKDEVFIVEGIPDTLTALELGLNAVGTLGAGNIPDTGAFNKTKEVYFIPDNDEDEKGYWAAINAGMDIFEKQSNGEVFILQLPKSKWNKSDLVRFNQAKQAATYSNYPDPKEYGGLQPVKDFNDWLKLGYDKDDFEDLHRKAEPILKNYIKMLGKRVKDRRRLEEKLDSFVYPLIVTRGSIVQQEYVDLIAEPVKKGGLNIGKTISKQKLKRITISSVSLPELEGDAEQQIDFLRKGKGKMNEYALSQEVSGIIYTDLAENSALYTDTVSGRSFVFRENSLIEISKDCREFQHLLHDFKINPSEKLSGHVTNELKIRAEKDGIQTTIHTFCHFVPETYSLYISANPGKNYRITETSIDLIDNGEDNVLLLPEPNSTPFVIAEELEAGLFEKIFLEPIVFIHDSLSPDEKRLLLDMAIRMVFFKSIMPTKIIPALVGQKGSKKSSTWRKMMKLFFGPNADVFQLPDKELDFVALAANRSIMPIDQVDQHKPYLNDCLAIMATGGIHTRRELYTNLGLKASPLNSFIFLTSREPHFRRDDVAERLLILKVDRPEGEKLRSEFEVNREVNENRPKLWRALMERLQEMIKALKYAEQFDPSEFDSETRMADFGSFVLKWGKLTDREDEVREILKKLAKEQSKFATDDDVLYALFLDWIDRPGNEGKVFKGPDLYEAFKQLAEEQNIEFPIKNARSFGRNFAKLIPTIKQDFIADVDEKSHVKVYLFHKKETVT